MSAVALTRALRLDAEAGEAPGYLFKTLTKMIGGRTAEPRSHVVACLGCLRELWSDSGTSSYRARVTGLLLRQLLRERYDDYGVILRAIIRQVQPLPELIEYIQNWAQGHFIPKNVLQE